MEEIALANAAIALLEILIPRIEQAAKSGQIPAADQQALFDRVQSLRSRSGGQFSGEGWTPSGS